MKFSIVVPSYNQDKFIKRTINSILTQKGHFEVECLVLDGGSTDKTVEIIKKINQEIKKGKYKNFNNSITFFWTSKKDNGQSDAINKGLGKATGDVLAYLNSDDSYNQGCFKQIDESFKNNPTKKWATAYCQIIDKGDKPIRNIINKYKNFWLRHYSYNKLLVLNFVSQPATFWKKEILEQYGFFNEKLHYTMDYDYWLRIAKKNNPIIVRSPLANFRIHGKSKGETAFTKQFFEDFATMKKYSKNRFLQLLHRLHNSLIIFFYQKIKNEK